MTYLRGDIHSLQLGREVGVASLNEGDRSVLGEVVGEFASHFGYGAESILRHPFIKLFPLHLRPYGQLYAY